VHLPFYLAPRWANLLRLPCLYYLNFHVRCGLRFPFYGQRFLAIHFGLPLRGNCICMPLLAFSDTDHNPLPFRSILGKKNSIQAHTKNTKITKSVTLVHCLCFDPNVWLTFSLRMGKFWSVTIFRSLPPLHVEYVPQFTCNWLQFGSQIEAKYYFG